MGKVVAARAAPNQEKVNPECPWRWDQGMKWSELMAASKPACSACWTSLSSWAGEICSCEAWKPIVVKTHHPGQSVDTSLVKSVSTPTWVIAGQAVTACWSAV